MQNISSNKIKSNSKGFKRISPSDLPPLARCYYYFCILYFINHYRKLIAHIFSRVKGELKLPMSIKHLERYLSGYKFTYKGFSKKVTGVNSIDGHCDKDSNPITIFYNKNLSKALIKFTKVHELFHFYQFIDPQVNQLFNDMIEYCGSNEDTKNIILSLREEAADLATFIYLMPPEYFDKKSQETKHTLTDLIEFMTDRSRDSINSYNKIPRY